MRIKLLRDLNNSLTVRITSVNPKLQVNKKKIVAVLEITNLLSISNHECVLMWNIVFINVEYS